MSTTSDTIPLPSFVSPIAARMRAANKAIRSAIPSYFVVMIDYGRPYVGKKGPSGCEAVVNPEVTRRDVVSRIVSGELTNIRFIHEVADGVATDVTLEMQVEASALSIGDHVREAFSIFNGWCDALGDVAPQADATNVARAS